ncbi:MAG: glycosyltransferase family 2 protein [Polyangiales bacterium]
MRLRTAVVIPALDAEATIAPIVSRARSDGHVVVVVDDGSRDHTAERARAAGAIVLVHALNRGKGAAIRTALFWAREHGLDAIVTLDADGQHPASQIDRLLDASSAPDAIVVGLRDLVAAGAPRPNQLRNAFARGFLSLVTATRLGDTQCGMRRYPVSATLDLGVIDDRFGFETEVVLRAIAARLPIVQVPIDVAYPLDRTTHFDSRRDPWRIVGRVLRTLLIERPGLTRFPRDARRRLL